MADSEVLAGIGRQIDRRVRALVRFFVAVARRFYDDRCLMHASALAYASLLSIVPLFALMFAVLKGLGVQRRLEPLLLSRLALEPQSIQQMIGYIDRTNVSTLGAVGAAALVFTVISLLGSIEASFNTIWRVRRSRSIWRKATDYLSVVLLTPLLLLVAVTITSSLHMQSVLSWIVQGEFVGNAVLQSLRVAPIAMNAIALGILYAVIPNRRPLPAAIIIGALLAGGAWQAVQWSYVVLQIGVARYNAIYGALSQLPVMLVWLYVSWAVVLAGAELAVVYEVGVDAAERPGQVVSRRAVALHLLVRAAEGFRGPGGGIDLRQLARQLQVSADVAEEVAESLASCGWLAAVEGRSPSYILAKDPAAISFGELDDLPATGRVPSACDRRARDLLDEMASQERAEWGRRSLSDLLDPSEKWAC